MTNGEFTKLRNSFHDAATNMLFFKNKEYANDQGDILANFHKIAKDVGVSPITVWYVFLQKHISAVANYLKNGKVKEELMTDRLIDIRNYVDLGYALLKCEDGR